MEIEKATLYIVGTPIGNLEDLSPRAMQVLSDVDFIAAEDTRVTIKLLNRFDIHKPLISYFEHNRLSREPEIIKRIQSGESCALVSDAGMPAISDPGETLVAACAEAGIPIYVIPGPTAVISALAVSGLPTGRFTFEGFLSMNKKNRAAHLASLQDEPRTMVFYEAPHKLRRTLSDLYQCLGDRRMALVREITKIHEEVVRTTISEAYKRYREVDPKGELVLVIQGKELEQERSFSLNEAVAIAAELHAAGSSVSEAAKQAAGETGLKKSDIYRAFLESAQSED